MRAFRAAAVKQVGILHRLQQGEERLHPGCFHIAGRQHVAELQRRQADREDMREPGGGLRPSAACTEAQQGRRAVAVQGNRAAHDARAPAPAHDRAQQRGK